MNLWKNQTDVINGFDFICKIEGSVIYEQVCTFFCRLLYNSDTNIFKNKWVITILKIACQHNEATSIKYDKHIIATWLAQRTEKYKPIFMWQILFHFPKQKLPLRNLFLQIIDFTDFFFMAGLSFHSSFRDTIKK